jgi:hypothetical protein
MRYYYPHFKDKEKGSAIRCSESREVLRATGSRNRTTELEFDFATFLVTLDILQNLLCLNVFNFHMRVMKYQLLQ